MNFTFKNLLEYLVYSCYYLIVEKIQPQIKYLEEQRMSIESVRTMIETSKTDAGLRQQLNAAEGPEEVLASASEKGYEFTQEELLSVMQEKQLSFGEELSEEQLETVAGGGKGNTHNDNRRGHFQGG